MMEDFGHTPPEELTKAREAGSDNGGKGEGGQGEGGAKPDEQKQQKTDTPDTGGEGKAADKSGDNGGGESPWWKKEGDSEGKKATQVDEATKTFLKTHFGNDDADAVIAQYKREAEELNGLRERAKVADQLEAEIGSFGPIEQEVIALMRKGEDWITKVKNTPGAELNWRQPGEKQDPAKLVGVTYPGEVTDEEWEAYNSGVADEVTTKKINTLTGLAVKRFDELRNDRIKTTEKMISDAKAQKKAYADSLKESAEYAKQQFPGLAARITPEWEKQMEPDGTGIPPLVRKLLFNDKGVLRLDAVLRLAFAEDGHTILATQVKAAQRKAAEDLDVERVTRMPLGGRGSGGGDAADGKDKVPDRIEQLRKEFPSQGGARF